jgi:flavin reductase (DIM6/NTAB) family NADH-FMN oxidoreductase RutF
MTAVDTPSCPTPPDRLSRAFREAFRCHPAGVAILTAAPAGQPVAITVSSLISVSAAPPVVAFSLSAGSSSATALLGAETIVIHLMRFADLDLAQLGATSGADRFGPGVRWARLPTGEPLYTDVGTWFRARIRGTLPVDGATVVAAELLQGEVAPSPQRPEEDSLVYLDRRWHRLRETLDGIA